MTSHNVPHVPGFRSRLVMAVLSRLPQARRPTPTRSPATWWPRRVPVMLAVASVILGGLVVAAQAQLNPGDILVVDSAADALSSVDPQTGQRTILSDFNDASQGPLGNDPEEVAVEAQGTILVIDADAGSDTQQTGLLFRIDPQTGMRIPLSDLGDPTQGPTASSTDGVAVEAQGTLLVTGSGGSTGDSLMRIDPGTGTRTLLSAFSPLGFNSIRVAVEAAGSILVTTFQGVLLRVDPVTGNAVQLSSGFQFPIDVAVVPSRLPFSVFTATARLTLGPHTNDDAFTVQGSFTLDPSSDGMAPLTEAVRLQVGVFSATIPEGSFTPTSDGGFQFAGTMGGVELAVTLAPLRGGRFKLLATGGQAELSDTRLPVSVGLAVGNDGSTALLEEGTARFK